MALRVDIVAGSTTPIYRQVVDQIRLAVVTGDLEPGDPLPSVRALAAQLVVNPNTIAKAYAELSRSGEIVSQRGRGMFIGHAAPTPAPSERRARLASEVERVIQQALLLGASQAEVLSLIREKWAALDEAGPNDET